MSKGDGASIAKSTRQERGAYYAPDFGDPNQLYPQLGRDVPYKEGRNGYPEMDLELRIESYGEHGLRRETRCPHCREWLSYKMCAGCQALVRMMGKDDRTCECFKESLYIYGNCQHHRMFQDPLRPGL